MGKKDIISASDVATADDVRRLLALDEERIAELQKDQEKRLKVFRSRARLTEKERTIGYAIEMERHHRLTGNKDALANALAAQGRFSEAAATARRDDLKQTLTVRLNAIEKDDADCKCPRYYKDGDHQLPNQYIVDYVVSEKHGGKLMPLIRCRECGELNVRAILPHLEDLRAVQNSDKDVKDYFRA